MIQGLPKVGENYTKIGDLPYEETVRIMRV
jgi:hypothetical protein